MVNDQPNGFSRFCLGLAVVLGLSLVLGLVLLAAMDIILMRDFA